MTANNKSSLAPKIVISAVTLFTLALLVIGSQVLKKDNPGDTTTASSTASTSNSSASDGTYKDGSYMAKGSYSSPGGQQTIAVNLTLSGNTVSDASVEPSAKDGVAQIYQSYFVMGYKSQVVGKKIDSIHLSRVSGSSLTSKGFNDALEQIKQQAKA